MKNIFYISLTGMTEPLGRSQVLEYLIELSKNNKIFLLSFERKNGIENIKEIKILAEKHDINWHYFLYSNKYGVLSTIFQIIKTIYYGSLCIRKNKIDIIHARSMIPATMGFILKKMYGVKLLFDIRGFAVDEKVDTGRLKESSILFKILKKLDNFLYKQADHIVTLTYTAETILHKTLSLPEEKITVIPTCANRSIFKTISEAEKQQVRQCLNYHPQDKIILHTGTVSGWYDFDSEVFLVKKLMEIDLDIRFLVLNKNENEFIQAVFLKYQLPQERVLVMSSTFDDVYKYLNIACVAIFFIKPSYSKQASAPTKFAENVACYLPSVTNTGVGDMSFYMEKYDVGYQVDLDKLSCNIDDVVRQITIYLNQEKINCDVYDGLFELFFDKKIAVKKYQNIYNAMYFN